MSMPPHDFELCRAGDYDVTVVLTGGRIVCRNCQLECCVATGSPGEALRHMLRHVETKHRVRRAVLNGLAVASAVLGEVGP